MVYPLILVIWLTELDILLIFIFLTQMPVIMPLMKIITLKTLVGNLLFQIVGQDPDLVSIDG